MKKLSLLFVFLITLSSMIFAQQKTVKGTVIDEDGNTLPGVTVMIKGTTKGVISDLDGKYDITCNEGDVLVFEYVGMDKKEAPVGASGEMNISLGAAQLDEVVVVGYTAQKQRDITGSVTKIDNSKLTEISSASLASGLEGAASGVMISSGSGSPGSKVNVKIRGGSSLNAGMDPLWIIDGVPMNTEAGGADPLGTINSNDIESINVLKDAQATAIYGSRGSNGVIIVTTKQGQKGKGQTSLSYAGGITMLPRNPENIGLANSEEYLKIMDQAMTNANINKTKTEFNTDRIWDKFSVPAGTKTDSISRNRILQTNTDWFDEILRTGQFHEFNYSTSNGFDGGNYYVSAGYKKIDGVIKGNDFQSLTSRINLNYDVFKNFKMEMKTSFGYTDNNKSRNGDQGTFGKATQNALPWFPIYEENSPSGYWNSWSGLNLVANQDLYSNRLQNYRGMGNVAAQYNMPWDWSKGLYLRSEAGFDYIQSGNLINTSTYLNQKGKLVTDESKTRYVINYKAFLNYNRTFSDIHNAELTLGTEDEQAMGFNRLITVQNPSTGYGFAGQSLPSNIADIQDLQSYYTGEQKMRSYFGRAAYKLMDKYIIGTSFRRDGSSKFLGENVWGNFSALSFGWIISDEMFFGNLKNTFNLLKLRGSFGQTGNNSISDGVFYNQWTNKLSDSYGLGSDISAGTKMSNIGNSSITWETTSSYDIGLDYGILQNRIEGSLAYYIQNVDGLLLSSPLPPSAILQSYRDNLGQLINSGFEFNITSTNIQKPIVKLKWTTDFNISTNTNEIIHLTDDKNYVLLGDRINIVGERARSWYMPEWAGLDKEKGIDLIYEIDQEIWKNEGRTVKTGNKIPATGTNLGKNKMVLEGKSMDPKYYGGFGSRFQYKNFDFNFRLTYAGGHYIYDYIEHRTSQVGDGNWNIKKEILDNSWTPENTDAKYPQITYDYKYFYDNDGNPSNIDYSYNNITSKYSRYLYKADYIRIKSIEIGYNFDKSIVDYLRLKNLRASASVTNLATFGLFYNAWDPEVIGADGYYNIPALRTFNIGLSVTF